ncbi:MAG TPA: radical SAM protein, partial [Anaerolineae bacterium]|nr:radical SAM protein [Anaerolineae bacterium]
MLEQRLSLSHTHDLDDIAAKVVAGGRLNFDDGMRLFQSFDLLTIGQLADLVNRRINGGEYVYFNQNRHINPTNVCAFHCNFCSFARHSDDEPGAYTWTPEQILDRIRGDVHPRVTEFHIVGGLHPKLGFEYYEEVLRALKREYPHIHLKAFTGVEIDFFAQMTGLDHETILRRLMDAGLGSMPGGGAEI